MSKSRKAQPEQRQTESAYMAVVMRVCGLEVWQAVVQKAVDDAQQGDAKARDWLTRYLLGEPSARLKAPRPTRVIAEQELGEEDGSDPVDLEKQQIRRDRLMMGL